MAGLAVDLFTQDEKYMGNMRIALHENRVDDAIRYACDAGVIRLHQKLETMPDQLKQITFEFLHNVFIIKKS